MRERVPDESPSGSSGALAGLPDFADDSEQAGERRRQRRAAAPAARWQGIAGNVYLLQAVLTALGTTGAVLRTVGGYKVVVLAAGVLAVGIALALGLLLRGAAASLARDGRKTGTVLAAGTLALVCGLLTLLSAVEALVMGLLMFRDGGFADGWVAPSALARGLLFLVVATCSLAAGVKTLLVPKAAAG
jgi:hypothetical protein